MLIQQLQQFNCDFEIDYSEVASNRIFPFIFELDQEESVFNPGPGENQRFCYNVTGVGLDNQNYVDLSHWVLGICDEIPAEQIVNISVVINGVNQPVEFGQNVELRTPQNPDPTTGCPGLKFDFELDKVEGEMTVCFELTETYSVGPNQVCLFGGGITPDATLSICGPVCDSVQTCVVTGYQPSTVCVPVTITPFANAITTQTFCCGDPMVVTGPNGCQGEPAGVCRFTITQNICVSVPVEFGATATVGDPYVQCGETSSEDPTLNNVPANNLNNESSPVVGATSDDFTKANNHNEQNPTTTKPCPTCKQIRNVHGV